MKMIAIGDNVVDCYVDQKVYYPGGNAINVAVGCKRAGFNDVAYLGVLGNDSEADHLTWSLEQEGIKWERCRRVYAMTRHARVKLYNGERVFLGSSSQETAQHIVRLRLIPDDFEYIKKFDLCHANSNSLIEDELPKIEKCCDISFDFSDITDNKEYLAQVCPYIRFAFFSGSILDEKTINELINSVHKYGVDIVGVTLGSKGALFSNNGKRYRQEGALIEPVIDTLGAGDSFISAFLTSYYNGADMKEALSFATDRARITCLISGGFGYKKSYEKEI